MTSDVDLSRDGQQPVQDTEGGTHLRGRFRRFRWREYSAALGILIVIVVALQVLLPTFRVPSYIIPLPSLVGKQLLVDLSSSEFWVSVLTTLEEVVFGCVLGAAFGILVGIALAQSALLEAILNPYIVALQSVPKIALAPILVVALGYGQLAKVVIAAILSFFPLLVNVIAGIRAASTDQLDLMRSLRASKTQTLRYVQLPGALPMVFAGLQVAAVFSVLGAIVGEFTGASRGLGYIVNARSFNLDQAGVFSALIILSAMGFILSTMVRMVGQRVVRWQSDHETPGK